MTLAVATPPETAAREIVLRESVAAQWSAEIVDRAAPADWASVGITVQRRLGDPAGRWQLRADRYVGVAELGSPSARVKLRVDPKIEADLFLLADWAYGRVRGVADVDSLPAHIDVLRREPAAVLLGWYLDGLEAFVIRWLRRDFQLRSDVLVGRVRGRILMPEYVTRDVAAGRPHHVPCQYLEASRDTLPNRILRRALHETARVIPTVGVPEARRHLHATVGRIEPFLSGVTNQPAAPGDFKRIRLGRAQRHYEPILRKSEAVLSGLFFSQQFGEHAQRAFLWDASILFQEALRGIFSSWDGAALDTARGRATLINADGQRRYSSKVDPDYVLRGPNGTFVLDAKWKNVLVAQEPAAPDDDAAAEILVDGTRIKISRSDVYQAVSYSHHEKYRPCETGLIFPVVLGAGEQLRAPLRMTGFGRPVWILFVDIGTEAREHFAAFFDSIAACWMHAD